MDGPPPPEEDFSALSIEARLAHKNWKARVSAYDTLIKAFSTSASEDDPAFRPYINNPDVLKKIATDSNAVAQEKGVECLVAFVKFAGEFAAGTRGVVIPAVVDKCLGSARAGTRNQAIELVLQYVEVENGGSGVVADIVPGLSAKQPKTVSGCVMALKDIVRMFGISVTPPQPVLKLLPKIFAHTDKTVRAEGTLLTHALYQYLGPAIEAFLGDLKPVQVKELKEAFEAMEQEGRGKGTLKPERLTRKQAREAEAAQMEGGDDGMGAPAEEEEAVPDARSLAEEIDIVPKFPSNLFGNLSSSKWKERKEALDDLLTVLSAALKIQDRPELAELAKALAICIQKDANVMCVTVAASCMDALARGVGGAFGRLRAIVVGPMLERLKERKPSVTDVIGNALDAVFTTTTLTDILEDIQPALSSKNPQVKEGTLKFLGRCLSTSPSPLLPPQIKPLSETLAALLEDSVAGCRDEAATCLGTIMKMVGERPLNALMESLADVRKVKVKEAFEKATVKAKAGGGVSKPPPSAKPAAAAPAPPSKPAPAKKAAPQPAPAAEDMLEQPSETKPLKAPPSRLTAKKPPAASSAPAAAASAAPPVTKKPPPAAAKAPTKAAPPVAAGALDTFKYKHTPEDAEALWTELIPANFQAGLGDSNWKVRLSTLEEMTEWIQGAMVDIESEVIVRFLAKKGWGEKNFQVSTKLYAILVALAEGSPTFGRSSAALCIGHLSEKLGDTKLKKPAGDALASFAEKTSLQFVLGHAYEPLGKQKAPKVLADALAWVDTALTEFGIAGVSLRSLIEFLKTALKNSNAAVRTSATKTLVTVKVFAGASIKDFLEDLNPQLLSTITSEFDKVEGNPAPEPTRTSQDIAAMSTPANVSGKAAAAGASDPLDDLFPRVELDGLLKGTSIIADAKSEAWKTKKEALETLQAILDQGANKRLKPTMGEIAQVLKARVVDTNKAVQSLALDIVSRIATGMGKPFEKHCRLFNAPIASVLADQKAPIRTAALQSLTAIATACDGLDAMIKDLTAALESPNPTQRAALLNWLAEWFTGHEPNSSIDLSSMINPVISSLDDRSADVRRAAQALLPALITSSGPDAVMHGTNTLKPASRKNAVTLIQSAQASARPRSDTVESVTRAPLKAVNGAPTAAKAAPENPRPDSATSDLPPEETVKAASAAPKRRLLMGAIPKTTSSAAEMSADDPPRARLPAKAGSGLQKSAVAASRTQSPTVETSRLLFSTTKANAKTARTSKDAQKWVNEGGSNRKELTELLHHQMEPHASKDLVLLLFSHDHNAVNDYVKGLGLITDFYASAAVGDDKFGIPSSDATAICVANCDLPLKYVSLKIHEPQSNLVTACLDTVDAIVGLLDSASYQLSDAEALCFIPAIILKLGDAREPVRARVQQIIQMLPKLYAYSHVFHLLLDHGLKSKVAKTRQGSLEELGSLLKRFGAGSCDPAKTLPVIAAMISDKDPSVRKSALSALSEAYMQVGEKIWQLVGPLSAKDRTQLEERLRRVAGPSNHDEIAGTAPMTHASRLPTGLPRAGSPALTSRPKAGLPHPVSSALSTGASRIARPQSPVSTARAASPKPSGIARPMSHLPGPASPALRPKTFLPSKLAPSKPKPVMSQNQPSSTEDTFAQPPRSSGIPQNGRLRASSKSSVTDSQFSDEAGGENVTIIISNILSSDPTRSVEALKKIQKVLDIGPEEGRNSPAYQELAEHTEGLVDTITVQMRQIFDRPADLAIPENFRLAKHLIQTLNAFCDHVFLAESLTVDLLTSLLEELTLRLLETDESHDSKVKDLSRFINMIVLRLFATARRMSIFRSLFALLLQIVKPFPANGTLPESKEARIAELVLKCIWKLARNMPQDLDKQALDPVELFPAIEHFLQSVPPNEWRARATNKVPCGDMPLRTVKVIVQHVVAHYADEVYDLLAASFDDPSATIVYPYVYRILNSSTRVGADIPKAGSRNAREPLTSPPPAVSQDPSRPVSPPETASSVTSGDNQERRSSPMRPTSQSTTSISGNGNGDGQYSPAVEEPDPDAQLITIINHISSETTGALHKEGITELHQFLKAYPHKKQKVDKMLESTGPAFRKYISRALASRAAEDQERDVAVSHTLSRLEANGGSPTSPTSPVSKTESQPRTPQSPRSSVTSDLNQERLSKLHDLFQYRSSTASTGSSQR